MSIKKWFNWHNLRHFKSELPCKHKLRGKPLDPKSAELTDVLRCIKAIQLFNDFLECKEGKGSEWMEMTRNDKLTFSLPSTFFITMEIAWRKVRIKLCLKSVKVCINFFLKAVCFMKYDINSPTFKANRLSFNDKSFSLKKQLLKIYKVAGISIVLVLPASIKSRPSRGAPIHHLSSPRAACNLWSHEVERVTRWEIVQKCLRNSYDNIDRTAAEL